MRRLGLEEVLPAPQPLAQAPWLVVQDDFASPEECAAVLALFADEDWVAAEADHYGWDGSGFAAEVEAPRAPLLAHLHARMEEALGRRTLTRRTLRMRYYGEGEGHPAHTDAYEADGLRLVATALLYLQDTEAGGETCFPAARPAPLAVAPRLGRVVLWTSTLPDGAADPASMHEGAPVLRGSKAVLLGFVYQAA